MERKDGDSRKLGEIGRNSEDNETKEKLRETPTTSPRKTEKVETERIETGTLEGQLTVTSVV